MVALADGRRARMPRMHGRAMRPNVSGTAAGVGNNDPIPICGWSGFGRTPLTRRLTADVPAGFGREMGNRRRVSIVLSSLHEPGLTILASRSSSAGCSSRAWLVSLHRESIDLVGPNHGPRGTERCHTAVVRHGSGVTPRRCDTTQRQCEASSLLRGLGPRQSRALPDRG